MDLYKINNIMENEPITSLTISACYGCEMVLECHGWDFMTIRTDTIEQAFEELSKFSHEEIKTALRQHRTIEIDTRKDILYKGFKEGISERG